MMFQRGAGGQPEDQAETAKWEAEKAADKGTRRPSEAEALAAVLEYAEEYIADCGLGHVASGAVEVVRGILAGKLAEPDMARRFAEEAAKPLQVIQNDPVDHPQHYTSHPSGVECIEITEWMTFNLGCATKYIWRAGEKDSILQDLRKARWYVDREISRLESLTKDES